MSNVDVLLLIPLIPALPVVVTWWLPWEVWLPKRVPKLLLGLYLLYAAFAALHFKLPWWCVLASAGYGTVALISSIHGKADTGPFESTKTRDYTVLKVGRPDSPAKRGT
jgi:hypothetical protein